MASIIVVFLTVGFLAALAVVALNYTPWWLPHAETAQRLTQAGLATLEQAYELKSTAAGAAPAPLALADGGLSSLFSAYYGFTPKPAAGMAWSYGHQSAAGQFQGADYICLSGTGVGFGEAEGVLRVANTLGTGQAIISTTCGATNPSFAGSATAYPAKVALTYYVQWVPGVQ